jgi:Tol biopolymer transport system component
MTDGSRILFGSSRGQRASGQMLWVQAVDETSGPEASDVHFRGYPNEWSPGGRLVLFTDMPGRRLMYWSRETRLARAVPNAGSARGSRPSPDGAWMAFQSDETGRDEVFVQTFPGALARWRVSARGGRFPVWARDGHELFFIEGGAMMAASVTVTSGKLQTATPVRLFDVKGFRVDESSYDVSPDGQFLMTRGESIRRRS